MLGRNYATLLFPDFLIVPRSLYKAGRVTPQWRLISKFEVTLSSVFLFNSLKERAR